MKRITEELKLIQVLRVEFAVSNASLEAAVAAEGPLVGFHSPYVDHGRDLKALGRGLLRVRVDGRQNRLLLADDLPRGALFFGHGGDGAGRGAVE